jgi:ADP-ribose pyrophosphatase YjhB (NUDIX family)
MFGSLATGCERLIKGQFEMLIPVKHSVGVAIFNGDEVLSVRRPDDDDELPGIWGLPAGTLKAGETTEDLIKRIGREKLGVELTPIRPINAGKQMRTQYLLDMELWEATMKGPERPTHRQWRWASIESLREGAEAGSLCCELGMKSKGRAGL